ncbi:hypothetical protein JCM10207_007266 [Rhodosporidiobolus poonsookiae]
MAPPSSSAPLSASFLPQSAFSAPSSSSPFPTLTASSVPLPSGFVPAPSASTQRFNAPSSSGAPSAFLQPHQQQPQGMPRFCAFLASSRPSSSLPPSVAQTQSQTHGAPTFADLRQQLDATLVSAPRERASGHRATSADLVGAGAGVVGEFAIKEEPEDDLSYSGSGEGGADGDGTRRFSWTKEDEERPPAVEGERQPYAGWYAGRHGGDGGDVAPSYTHQPLGWQGWQGEGYWAGQAGQRFSSSSSSAPHQPLAFDSTPQHYQHQHPQQQRPANEFGGELAFGFDATSLGGGGGGGSTSPVSPSSVYEPSRPAAVDEYAPSSAPAAFFAPPPPPPARSSTLAQQYSAYAAASIGSSRGGAGASSLEAFLSSTSDDDASPVSAYQPLVFAPSSAGSSVVPDPAGPPYSPAGSSSGHGHSGFYASPSSAHGHGHFADYPGNTNAYHSPPSGAEYVSPPSHAYDASYGRRPSTASAFSTSPPSPPSFRSSLLAGHAFLPGPAPPLVAASETAQRFNTSEFELGDGLGLGELSSTPPQAFASAAAPSTAGASGSRASTLRSSSTAAGRKKRRASSSSSYADPDADYLPPTSPASSSASARPISPITGKPTKIISKRGWPPKDAAKRVYFCEVEGCGKSFGRPSARDTHMRSHDGVKPFVCPIPSCARGFSVFSNLKRHMIVHPTVDFRHVAVHDLPLIQWVPDPLDQHGTGAGGRLEWMEEAPAAASAGGSGAGEAKKEEEGGGKEMEE